MLLLFQRALKASRQDIKKMTTRKRKKRALIEPDTGQEEQTLKFNKIQKRIEKTKEMIDRAKNLDKSAMPVNTVVLYTKECADVRGVTVCGCA